MCFATSCKLFRTLENCKNIGNYGLTKKFGNIFKIISAIM